MQLRDDTFIPKSTNPRPEAMEASAEPFAQQKNDIVIAYVKTLIICMLHF